MRTLDKYPMPSQLNLEDGEKFVGEVLEEWQAQAQRAGIQTQYGHLIKLAYRLGYNCCASLNFS